MYNDYANYKKNKAYALRSFLKSAFKKIDISKLSNNNYSSRQCRTPKAAEKKETLYQEIIKTRTTSKSRNKSKELRCYDSESSGLSIMTGYDSTHKRAHLKSKGAGGY